MPPKATAIQTAVLKWYDAHRRPLPWRTTIERSHSQSQGMIAATTPVPEILEGRHPVTSVTPYGIWVCEIMSQQTQIATLIPYWLRWMHKFPTVEALAAADLDTVRESWAGLGYYRRAAFLHKGAQYVVEKHGGTLPQTEAELLAVPGIGPYTAAAIASVCFDVCTPVVDGNVLRVISRLEGMREADVKAKITVDAVRKAALSLMSDCPRPGDFNQAIMEIGATVCKPAGAPQCASCPLASRCAAKKLLDDGTIPRIETVIPLTSKSKEKTVERYAAVLFVKPDDRFLLTKRPENSGLLAGMWQVPQLLLPAGSATTTTDVGARGALLKELFGDTRGGEVVDLRRVTSCGEVHHAFSHIDYTASVFRADVETKASKAIEKAVGELHKASQVAWVSREEASTMALSTVAKRVLNHALRGGHGAPSAKRTRSAEKKSTR